MSDIVKLNIRSGKFRAVISDGIGDPQNFIEFPELLEKENQEQAYKLELEKEYQKGYNDGEANTIEALEKKHSEELLNQSKNFYSILVTFEEKIKIFERDFHKLVISVSKKISEKIIGSELTKQSNIEKLLEENLRKIIGANDIIVKLNPKDFELIEKSSRQYLGLKGVSKIKFEPNESVQVGGCFVESEIGNLDARVDARIEEIIKSLENKFTNIICE